MAMNSSIEWTDHTFNPWWGCTEVSPGCDNCYARAVAARFAAGQVLWGVDAGRRTFGARHWSAPAGWNGLAAAQQRRHRVFAASMADVFDNRAPAGERERLFVVIRSTPHLDWLLLTKRIGNAVRMLPHDWNDGYANVWLGISVVDQVEADRDIPKLLATPTRLRFLSMEPLLGPVQLDPGWLSGDRAGVDWVIVGGESGRCARPMNPDWARSLRDQCERAGVPFFFKQWGEFVPADVEAADTARRHVWTGKRVAGRLLDGRVHNEFPGGRAAGSQGHPQT